MSVTRPVTGPNGDNPIANEQIRELRDAAYRDGDEEFVGVCHTALGVYDPGHVLTFASRDAAITRCAAAYNVRRAKAGADAARRLAGAAPEPLALVRCSITINS